MFPQRRFHAVVRAALLAVAVICAALLASSDARAQSSCEGAADLAFMASPLAPWKGAPLRVVFAAEKPLDGELALIAPDGRVAATARGRPGGPPYVWIAEVALPAPGQWQARLTSERCGAIAREIAVRADRPPPPRSVEGSVWPIRASWNRATENLFSAWVEKLFDDPLDAQPSWPALHFVLRDRARNILFNHLGLGEDEMKMVLRPDCADLPYFLRAYFAFKMGLPFGYSVCTRGGGGKAPRCPSWYNIQNLEPPPNAPQQATAAPTPAPAPRRAPLPLDGLFGRSTEPENATPAPPPAPVAAPPKRLGLTAAFAQYSSAIGGGVHSAAVRTALADNNTDFYPVALTPETLRPGAVYGDPYGHILIVVKRVPQSADSAGIILAVDGQPDGTVARKRFWRGNFLFAQDPALGGPGFKRYRPVVRDQGGALRRLSNDEIARSPQYADFSLDQGKLSVEAFYDRMDDVMSPRPLDPLRAMTEAIVSLEEQVKTRVISIENGRKWQASAKGEAKMPDGPAIFETTGPWEDFSTPSRDLRLLIAIDVVLGFPERVARRPERYAMPRDRSAADVKAELQRVLATELAARKFSYPRSDGSPWTLALKDVIERRVALEMAYNPNDCVELRWGAPEKSEEAAPCKRYAPQAQRMKMAKYRPWFAERRRPPRP